MRRHLMIVGALFLLLSACDARVGPEPMTCDGAPSEATITDLAISTGPLGFRPIADGSPLYTETASDGSTIASLRAAWRSDTALPCAKVKFLVFHPGTGAILVDEELSLNSTPLADWSSSGQVFYDADEWPSEVVVELRIYGMTLRLTLPVGGWEPPDAGV